MNRHHLFIAFVAALAVAAPACKKSNDAAPGEQHSSKDEAFGRMSVDDVDTKLKETKEGKVAFYVFDNNSKSVFEKGHVPGAKWVDPGNLQTTDLPADKEATLVFYCANEQCMACHEGAESAVKLGYKKVFIMPSGIAGWKKAGKAVEPAS